jgi:hypothetical protein
MMQVTILKNDGVVAVDGVARTVDVSGMPEGVRVMQWNGTSGHSEYYNDQTANTAIETIAAIQSFIDLWNAAAPPVPPLPTAAQRIAAAHARINLAYESELAQLTADYPPSEIDSWSTQEKEARAKLENPNEQTLWIKAASSARKVSVDNLVARIIKKADEFAPIHGALTGKRQVLRDRINALGSGATQQQLDAIVW